MNKQLIQSIKTSLWFLLGILIASVPWLFYFGINRAMPDWIHTYFTINLTMYPESLSPVEIIRSILLSFRKHLYLNPASVSLIFLGMFVFVTNKKYIHHALHRFSLLFSFLLLALGVYVGGKDYIYYFLIFSPFIVFGFIILADLYADTYGSIKSKTLLLGLILIIFIVTLAYTYRFNRNRYMLSWEKDDMVQYKFATIMEETNHPTLLNYGFQDGGFYTIAGITPNVRFFQKYNFSYGEFPLNMDEQNRYIKEGFVDYVVLRLESSDELKSLDVPFLYDNYELTATEDQLFGETNFVYLLFKHK